MRRNKVKELVASIRADPERAARVDAIKAEAVTEHNEGSTADASAVPIGCVEPLLQLGGPSEQPIWYGDEVLHRSACCSKRWL
jgi:hypothetical protein